MATSRYTKTHCSNCGFLGHHFRGCIAPIYSYGILAFRVPSSKWASVIELSKGHSPSFPVDSAEVLMIQRRDSIGFIELLRAKYKVTDIPYICSQLEGTTPQERELLRTKSFDELWTGLWGTSPFESKQYRQEFEQAKVKFELLREGVQIDDSVVTLNELLDRTPLLWDTPEWGFPKGRRNTFETDLACAIREFEEETTLNSTQYTLLESIQPLEENFYGNNNIHYCHIYYLAIVPYETELGSPSEYPELAREISKLAWVSCSEAIQKIRNTNPEKRDVLRRARTILSQLVLVSLPN